MDVEDSSDDVCERICRRCGFGVNLVKNCVGLGLPPPKVSRSGNDFEYFSSEADRLFCKLRQMERKIHFFHAFILTALII